MIRFKRVQSVPTRYNWGRGVDSAVSSITPFRKMLKNVDGNSMRADIPLPRKIKRFGVQNG